MKIGVAQLSSNDDIQKNFNQIKGLIVDSLSEKPEVICFPENSLYMRIDPNDKVKALSLDDKIITEFKELCAKTQIAIHLTTAIQDDKKIFNASVLIDTQYNAQIVYRKIHLFDIELSGEKPQRESDVFSSGAGPSVFVLNRNDRNIFV